MYRATRRTVALSMMAFLAACGGSKKPSKFKSYSGPPVTQIVVNKGERRMHLISGKTVLKSYDIGLGWAPSGSKRFEGDGKTPEGIFFVDRFNPRSAYHLSVGVNYPRPQDRAYAEQFGRNPGGDIFIHGWGPEGNAKAPSKKDWTAGCIAVKDEEIEEIFAMVQKNTPVVIYP